MGRSLNTRGDDLALERATETGPGPSCADAGEEIDTDLEIVEESDECKTARSVPATVKSQLDLTLATYCLGRSLVDDAELDKYVEQGLLKALLHGLCCTPG